MTERERLIREAEEVVALIEDDIPAVSEAGMYDLIWRMRDAIRDDERRAKAPDLELVELTDKLSHLHARTFM